MNRGPQTAVSAQMEEFSGLHPREVVRRVSSSLGCSPSSPQVAAYFDENDDLRHLRQHFLMPKVADLPACEWQTESALRSACTGTHQWTVFTALQLTCRSWTAARNASTSVETLWAFSQRWPGNTWRRSWTSGPERTSHLSVK